MGANSALFEALYALEREKNISKDYMLEKIKTALVTAVKRENAVVEIDEAKKTFRMFYMMNVVEEVLDPETEMTLDQARIYSKRAVLGSTVQVEVATKDFNRITASTAKQVIIQAIRESERGNIYNELSSKAHEILNALVTRVDPKTGNIFVEVGGREEESEAVLPVSEQIKGEVLREGDRVKVYLVEVRKGAKAVSMIISRTHPGLVKRLFELEVPEIHDGVVEIKNIAREAGSRTKISVYSPSPEIDPVGACVGPKGSRVETIVAALGGEKIDIVHYSENPAEYVKEALSPSDVTSVTLLAPEKICRVVVPDDQLSLAIGKEGQNARLAAKLTGMKIDIKPESAAQ
ncbi:MAG: transcription termination/antitermination protein NusA [Clostridia bacterium]|nr:transcription termination/antitermination protein NusA [Clostridia bacterium]